MSGSDAAMKLVGVARAKLRTTFLPRFELRVPRFFFDLPFVAAKVAADYADLNRGKQDRTGDCAGDVDSQGEDGLPTCAWSSGSAPCDLL